MKKLLTVLFLVVVLSACSKPENYYYGLERTYRAHCDPSTLKATITETDQGTVFMSLCQKAK